MKKLYLTKSLIIAAIILLAAFQAYWLVKLYKDEHKNLRKEVDVAFRETIYKLQRNRFEKDSFFVVDGVQKMMRAVQDDSLPIAAKTRIVAVKKRIKDSLPPKFIAIAINPKDVLSTISPNEIDSIKLNSPKNIRVGVPPLGLMEVFIKQKMALGSDTGFTIQRDTLGNKTIIRYSSKKLPSIKDSMASSKIIRTDVFSSTHTYNYTKDSVQPIKKLRKASPIINYLSISKSVNDSIPIAEIDSAYKAELNKGSKKLAYTINYKPCTNEDIVKDEVLQDSSNNFATSKVLIGFNNPLAYQATFSNVFSFLIKKMSWQIVGSILLLLFVTASFIALYRNILAQQKLAAIKNDFISNITHELKTPIATVAVAIEALRSFGASASAEKNKEYLDISASELQRLNLLVDKVLKLSMFENKEIELQKEQFDLHLLLEEVMATMKLQFDKYNAVVSKETQGNNFLITADKLHITSVLYNLLDNALKYSPNNPTIQVALLQQPNTLQVSIADNGIGIAQEYKEKIFEKFFRVPTGNIHNIKGYGLGLSYVQHVINKHKGSIQVHSQVNKGSIFIIQLPI
jgi:signal transduction histidine kinase